MPLSAGPQMLGRDFLIRGLLAGLFAGVVAFGFAYFVGEPPVDAAIAVEEAGADHSHDEEAGIPRSLQSTVGLLTGTAVAGVTIGGVVGVLSALALGRFGTWSPRATTLGVTAAGFLSLYVIPFIAYPPNPPAVGSGDTIGYRTTLYFVMVAISVITAVVAILIGRRLTVRIGGWYATYAALGGYLLVSLVLIALLPTYNEVQSSFPASILYDFRTASFVTQLALWTTLGVVLAETVHRLVAGRASSDRLPVATSVS